MSSIYRIRKRTAVACLFIMFGIGIATERYRQYWKTNQGDLSVQRTDPGIALAIDGDTITQWYLPLTLRAGAHQFHATWREFQAKTTINVKRGDEAQWNRVEYSIHNGQLQVQHNSRLVDVAPRPEPEVCEIHTASGKLWHTTAKGEIVLRLRSELDEAQSYTIHWLRPDHSEAFIESSDGRFVTNTSVPTDTEQGFLRLSHGNELPSLFEVARVKGSESWIKFATGRHFVDVDVDPARVRTTRYESFASPHFLVRGTNAYAKTNSAPLPTAIPVVQNISSAASVRRFKGHTNVIHAVLFTLDGRHVISGSSDRTIRFWNLQSGKQVDVIQTHRPALSLAISSDGKSLACGMADSVVKYWKLEYAPRIAHHDERILSRDYRGEVHSIAFSPEGTKVAAGGDDQMGTRIWNLLAPDERCKSASTVGPVTSLAWSRSGERLLLFDADQRLHWWPKRTDTDSRGPSAANLLIQSAQGPLVISGGDLLDAESNQAVYSFEQRKDAETVSAQMSDLRELLVTGEAIYHNTNEFAPDALVSVWDLKTGRPRAVLRDRFGQVGNVAISPDAEHVAYGYGQTVTYNETKRTGDYDLRVWKVPNNEP